MIFLCLLAQGNNRRLYLDKLRQALQASGGSSSVAGAGASSSASAAAAAPSTPRYTPQQSNHEQLPIKHEGEDDDEGEEGEESKMMDESEHDSDD